MRVLYFRLCAKRFLTPSLAPSFLTCFSSAARVRILHSLRIADLCVEGSSAPQPCPSGYHANQTVLSTFGFLSTLNDCVRCGVGVFCPVGSNQPTACAPGTFNDQLNASTCENCPAGTFQAVAGSTACNMCTPGYYCAEGSAAPLPCPGGTRKDESVSVMTSVTQCITCPAGTSCSVGSAEAMDCLPGSVANRSAMETCKLCGNGKFQRAYGQTACASCEPGFFCKVGAAEPVPCPAGYVGNATGLYSPGQCTPVARGFWAPLGSSIPEPCPISGFYCPGALRDDIHGGAKPVIMPVGQSTETQEVETVQQTMKLDLSIDDFAAQREALIQRLARQYRVNPSLITLEATAARRRTRALQSGGLELTITIATSDGSGNQVNISTIENAAAAVDASTLAATISEVTVAAGLPPVTVTALQVPERATAAIEVPFSCPLGKWCTAGLVVDCPLGSYNPLQDQDFATACVLCPDNSYTAGEASTSRSECVCVAGYYDANSSQVVDQALVDNMIRAGRDPIMMMADAVECLQCPIGTDCGLGSKLETLPLIAGFYRLDNTTVDVRECPDARKNCSATFGTDQCESASGCQSGSTGCAPGLGGRYCELCDRSDGLVFYRAASDDAVATCVACGNTITSTATIALSGLVVVGLLILLLLFLRRKMSPQTSNRIKYFNESFTPRNKFKITMTFYQLSTKVPPVYEVVLPPDINAFLDSLSSLFSFGIDSPAISSTPLECMGLNGYTYKLIAYMALPPVLVLVVVLVVLCTSRRAKPSSARARTGAEAKKEADHAGGFHLESSEEPESEPTFFQKTLPAVMALLFILCKRPAIVPRII